MAIHTPSGSILHERARFYHWQGQHNLSIKTFWGGRAHYAVDRGTYAVDDESYLILNQDQSYAITIASDRMVESFCVFFAPHLAESIQHSLTEAAEVLLDTPGGVSAPVRFFERTYPHDAVISPTLRHMHVRLGRGNPEPGWLDEQFHLLMEQLLIVYHATQREVQRVPAMRAATREELYCRLYLARDYAAAMWHMPITLADLAGVACLSPNYFLRMFLQVFHQTPHQFITAKRLESAQKMLVQSDESVTSICAAVGFASLGSFSALFRQQVGLSPAAYRRSKR